MRALVAIAWGTVAAVAAYAALRIGERLASPEADPAIVGWSVHAAFFWRAWTVAFGGGIAAFVVYVRVAPDAAARALAPAIGVAAALLVVAAVWFP